LGRLPGPAVIAAGIAGTVAGQGFTELPKAFATGRQRAGYRAAIETPLIAY